MITKQMCIQEIKKLYKDFGKVTNQIIKENGSISPDTMASKCGSLKKAYQEAGLTLTQGQRKNVSKKEIVIEIYRILDNYGYVSKPLMEKHSSYSPKIVQRIFGSFKDMYKELDIPHSSSGRIPTNKELIIEAKRIYNEQGFLSYDLIYKFGTISATCFKDRTRRNNSGGINYYRQQVGCKIPSLAWGESPSAKYAIAKFSNHLKESPIKEKTFKWLKNPKTNMSLRIDAFYPNANIAIEYNGPQHYFSDGFYTKNEQELTYKQNLDFLKQQLIKAHGIKLVVIHYKDKVDTHYILSSLT